MSGQSTIRDALLDLRRLIEVTRKSAEENLAAFTEAVNKAQETFDATTKATETLDKITTQLGFSVVLERATSEASGRGGHPGFPSATAAAEEQEEADEGDDEEETTPRRRRRRRRRASSNAVASLRDKIVALRRDGHSHREIAKRLNIGHATVWRELAKLPEDPLPAQTATEEPEAEETQGETVLQDPDPRFRFKLNGKLAETEAKALALFKKNYPDFTTATEMKKRGVISDETVAGAFITRLRRKDVPVESAKQARDRGEDIAEGVSGWRLIVEG